VALYAERKDAVAEELDNNNNGGTVHIIPRLTSPKKSTFSTKLGLPRKCYKLKNEKHLKRLRRDAVKMRTGIFWDVFIIKSGVFPFFYIRQFLIYRCFSSA